MPKLQLFTTLIFIELRRQVLIKLRIRKITIKMQLVAPTRNYLFCMNLNFEKWNSSKYLDRIRLVSMIGETSRVNFFMNLISLQEKFEYVIKSTWNNWPDSIMNKWNNKISVLLAAMQLLRNPAFFLFRFLLLLINIVN